MRTARLYGFPVGIRTQLVSDQCPCADFLHTWPRNSAEAEGSVLDRVCAKKSSLTIWEAAAPSWGRGLLTGLFRDAAGKGEWGVRHWAREKDTGLLEACGCKGPLFPAQCGWSSRVGTGWGESGIKAQR